MRVGTMSSVALAALLLPGGLGCGQGPVPVSGKVTLDGEPVAAATLAFVPAVAGRPAFAVTETDGSYQVTTQNPGDGAWPGEYTVTIVWEPSAPPIGRLTRQELREGRQELRQAYEQEQAKRQAKAEYEARVKKVVGKGPSIPALYGSPSTTPLKVKVPAPGGRVDFALKK